MNQLVYNKLVVKKKRIIAFHAINSMSFNNFVYEVEFYAEFDSHLGM